MMIGRRDLVAALALMTLAAPGRAAGGQAVVVVSNFTFTPPEIRVAVGSTVTFRNDDDIPHQVIADDGSFRTSALDTGDAQAITFGKAGSFGYYCGLHPHMQGKVVVVP
jgi:plastocyanin